MKRNPYKCMGGSHVEVRLTLQTCPWHTRKIPVPLRKLGFTMNRLFEIPKWSIMLAKIYHIEFQWYLFNCFYNIWISSFINSYYVPLVKEVIKQRSTIYHNKIVGHENVLIQPLLEPHNERRLKKELASRPTRRLMMDYFWISLFTSY
jgi:hypothetical protein